MALFPQEVYLVEAPERIMETIHNIGILYYMPRNGGGTYQLTENVMCVLADYAAARPGYRIHLFYNTMELKDLENIKLKFPTFLLHKIGKSLKIYSSLLKRMFVAFPPVICLLRHCFPLNWIANQHNIDLMILAGITFEASFYKRRQITLFTDIAHVFYPHFPELAANGELRRRNILFKYGVRYADQLVVESNQLRSDTVKYYAADPTKIAILPQTVSQTLVASETSAEDAESAEFRRTLPKSYFFYPAQLWEHKNHIKLLNALKILIGEFPNLHLILVGSRQRGDQVIFDMIEKLGLSNNVIWMGYVCDAFIRILYKNTCALVKPGYIGPTNIPTLEAFYYGCPAIISDIPGAREQTEDAALLFEPDSYQDMAAKMRMVLTDEALRRALILKGYERLGSLGYQSYRKTFFDILDKNFVSIIHE